MLDFTISAFHDYDIRGIYPEEVHEDFFYHVGKAAAQYYGIGTTIGVGYDARPSSPSLAKSLVDGLIDYGVNVVDLGQISTEMHYFSAGTSGFDGNIIITASHNPSEYNGAKFVKKGVIPLHGNFGLPEIASFVNKEIEKPEQKGTVTKKDVLDDYIHFALQFIDVSKQKQMKVVVDTGNGVGGKAWERVLGKLGAVEIIPLYFDIDGTFPNHHPDPIKDENIVALVSKVKEEGADLGIAIDGDADRIFFVDDNGVKLSGTVTLALYCDYLLKQGKVGAYIYNASIGRIVKETIEKYSGTPVRVRGGHAYFKEKMRELGGIFGGEHSGHYGHKDCFNSEMTLILGLMMIDIISRSGFKLSELRQEFDKYPAIPETNFKIENSELVINELKELFKDEVKELSEIDGVSFTLGDCWFIVRSSKTEPLMRVNMDANSKEILEQRFRQVIEVIEKYGGVKK